ncbi:hypothetical protein ACWN8V_01625 [Vagococcus elongatus]|nr:hypothetical protein [Vagococcus elongatus]
MKINWGIKRKNRLFILAILGAAFLVGKLVLPFLDRHYLTLL